MPQTDNRYALIDQGAPRTNQAIVAAIVVLAFVLDLPWLLPALAGILYTGVILGRRFILPYYLYFHVIQPRIGEVWMEDERAPRFAQGMGATGLLAGYLCIVLGAPTIGWGLVLLLAAAAMMSTFFGICVGCLTYRLFARLRGVRPVLLHALDLDDVGLPSVRNDGAVLVEFGHPLCSDCQVWEQRLQQQGQPFVTVNVSERPEVARKYGIRFLPTVFEVAQDGRVLRQITP